MNQTPQDRLVEELFNAGLDALIRGESIEPILAPHPQHAVTVRSMLQFATNLRSVLEVAPNPTARAATRYQVMARAQKPRRFWGSLVSGWGLPRTITAAALIAALLLGTTSGAVAVSANALPGDPLYLVKTQVEDIQLALAFTEDQKAEFAINRAANRTTEIAGLAAQGKPVSAETIARLASHTSFALALAESAKATNIQRLLSITERQLEVLAQVAASAPPAALPGLERALEAGQQGRDRAFAALERAKPAATPGGSSEQAGPGQPNSAGGGAAGDLGPTRGPGAGGQNGAAASRTPGPAGTPPGQVDRTPEASRTPGPAGTPPGQVDRTPGPAGTPSGQTNRP
ncbi:MAG: hypothetical protein EXR51_07190 [Dehalococcoidia bacterium]|nr:hypothetical protein [Dehalococcoidia bacterium]